MNDTDLLGKPETKTLTKADLVSCLFSRLGLNKQEAREIVEVFFDEIRAALEQGESVKLSGFGHFQLRDKSPRPGRNPKTGDVVPVSGRRVVTFRVSPKMRCFLEGAGVSAPAESRA